MGIIIEQNSLHYLTGFPPVRSDTHFKHYIKLCDHFFSNEQIKWVGLGSVLEKVRNGMNLSTNFYSMDDTDILYLSVSQIKEYGLIDKNQNYLLDDVRSEAGFFELEPDMLLITRSGTIGVALSTNNRSFEFNENSYIASGFVITAKIKEGFSSDIIAGYLNIFDVHNFLTAMAAGACQKNISQPTINQLPIPECFLVNNNAFDKYFNEYMDESNKILADIDVQEKKLIELKKDISSSITSEITNYYQPQ